MGKVRTLRLSQLTRHIRLVIRFLFVGLRFRYPFFPPTPRGVNLGSRYKVRRQLRLSGLSPQNTGMPVIIKQGKVFLPYSPHVPCAALAASSSARGCALKKAGKHHTLSGIRHTLQPSLRLPLSADFQLKFLQFAFRIHFINLRPKTLELNMEVLIPAFDEFNVIHHGNPLRGKPRNHERRPGA